jgi:hypothetical protein
MKKFIITEEEKNNILGMYKNTLLNEDIFSQFIGALSKFARKAITQSEDDLIKAFRTTEVALAKNIDDIVNLSLKSGKIDDIQTLEAKLIHAFDPSGTNPQMAQEQVKKFLNSYAKSRGNTGWKDIRSKAQPSQSGSAAQSNTAGASTSAVRNMFSGNRISNRSFGVDTEWSKFIEWDKILNAKNIDDYNKLIAKAIKTGDYSHISSKGFERFGIDNFRDFLKNNITKVNEVIPETGRWSVIFK